MRPVTPVAIVSICIVVVFSILFSGCKKKCIDALEAVNEGMTQSDITQLLGDPAKIKREPGLFGTPGTETWIWLADCDGGVGYRVTFLAEEWVGPSGKYYPAGLVSGWGAASESDFLSSQLK